jgi:hypothetical protein
MTSPYQNSVVGSIQTILLDLPPNAVLAITDIPNWANYRWIIQPFYGSIAPALEYIHEVDAAAAQGMTGAYDSGWWQSSAPVGYAPGDAIAPADTYYQTWWTSRSLEVPVTRRGPVALPVVVPLGYGCTGVRVISFAYFGGFDADTQNLILKTGDATGLDLVDLGNGYYLDSTGKVWRNSWQPPYDNPLGIPGPVSLGIIASKVCKRGGLSVTDYEADDLVGTLVAGYPIARQANAADCLLPLMQAYFGYASEYDAQLHFKFYGADANVVIDRADLIEGNDSNKGAIVSNLRNQSTEFPRRIVAAYMDPAQNYTVVNVPAERQATDVIAIGDQSFQIPVVMSADTAAQAAQKALKVAYATLEGKLEYSTPFAGADVYLSLAAGEPLQMLGKRYVADEMTLGVGGIKFTTRYDRQSAYTSDVQAIAGNLPTAPASPYSGPTTLIPMNLPSLRPQDTYGLYLAAASTDGRVSWQGCTVQVSYDNQASWQNALQMTEASVWGRLGANEPSGGEPLTARMNGDLSSATDDQLAARANAFAFLHSAGAEIGQFKTATETATAGVYELTNVLRGQLGTAATPGAIGEQLVMLDAVYFLPIDLSFAGKTLYFRAVGFGEDAESAVVIPLVYSPDMTVVHDGGTVTP